MMASDNDGFGLDEMLARRPADLSRGAAHRAAMEADLAGERPALPLFAAGETKRVNLEFTERDGSIMIEIDSAGMAQDPNQIALLLHFALEKLLDA